MKKIRFGGTGLKVAPLAFGTMTIGDRLDRGAAFKVLNCAVERGVNFFDCANMYNAGEAERIVGAWIKERGLRDQIVLSSKVRYEVGDDPLSIGLTPKVVMREIQRSLERLQTDYIDIYFLHQADDDTPIELTLRCVDDLISSGKVRYLGMSNFAAWQVVQAVQYCRENSWTRPTVLQSIYNAITRGLENEMLPMAKHYDLGVCVYNPLAGGLLTGKHSVEGQAAPGSRFESNQLYRERYWDSRQRTCAASLAKLAKDSGRSPVELAIRFIMDQPGIHVTLLGATKLEQLEQCLDVFDASPLTGDEIKACDKIWNELHGPVPAYWRTN